MTMATGAAFSGLFGVSAFVVHWLLYALVLGSVLALLTWLLLRTAFRGARPALQAVFWVVVLIKFIVPSGPGWTYSLSNLVAQVAPLPSTTEQDVQIAPVVGLIRLTAAMQDASTTDSLSRVTLSPVSPHNSESIWQSALTWRLLILLAGLAYVACVVAIGLLRIRAYMRFAARCRRLPSAGRGLRRIVARVCRQSDIRRLPDVRLSEDAPAPFVFGLFRPTLVLSPRQLSDRRELEAVLLHEVAHLRRFDLAVRYLQWLAGTLLFFWPLVAWVNRRIDLARELACDEWALRHSRLQPRQYARCLLQALQPAAGVRSAYRPAAMATSARNVERRIDMILSDRMRRHRARRAGLIAAVGVTAWTAFVLTGMSSAAQESAPQQREDSVGTVFSPIGKGTPFLWRQTSEDGLSEQFVAMHIQLDLSPETLADFAAQYPTADADGDGLVTREEHDAYLAALALLAPDAVLEQFPGADRDGDGLLIANEAARLVTGVPTPSDQAFTFPGTGAKAAPEHEGGQQMVFVHRAEDDGQTPIELTGQKFVFRSPSGETLELEGGTQPVKVIVQRVEENGQVTESTDVIVDQDGSAETRGEPGVTRMQTDDGRTIEMKLDRAQMRDRIHAALEAVGLAGIGGEGQTVEVETIVAGDGNATVQMNEAPLAFAPLNAAPWLLENILVTPTADEVAAQIETVRRAPLEAFLEMNPDADFNGDGVLTVEERDRFIERHLTEARQKLLERCPEADANADGLLTNDELDEFFHSRCITTEARPNGDGSVAEVKVEIVGDGGEAADVEQEVILRRIDEPAIESDE